MSKPIKNAAATPPPKSKKPRRLAAVPGSAVLRTVGELVDELQGFARDRFVMVLNEQAILDHPTIDLSGDILVLTPGKTSRRRPPNMERSNERSELGAASGSPLV